MVPAEFVDRGKNLNFITRTQRLKLMYSRNLGMEWQYGHGPSIGAKQNLLSVSLSVTSVTAGLLIISLLYTGSLDIIEGVGVRFVKMPSAVAYINGVLHLGGQYHLDRKRSKDDPAEVAGRGNLEIPSRGSKPRILPLNDRPKTWGGRSDSN
jgi:hypothetical protein